MNHDDLIADIPTELLDALDDLLRDHQLPRRFGTPAWWCEQIDPHRQLPWPVRERAAQHLDRATKLTFLALRRHRTARIQQRRQEGLPDEPPPAATTEPLDLDALTSVVRAPGPLDTSPPDGPMGPTPLPGTS